MASHERAAIVNLPGMTGGDPGNGTCANNMKLPDIAGLIGPKEGLT
jgi:hypothetical protein